MLSSILVSGPAGSASYADLLVINLERLTRISTPYILLCRLSICDYPLLLPTTLPYTHVLSSPHWFPFWPYCMVSIRLSYHCSSLI